LSGAGINQSFVPDHTKVRYW